MSPSNGELVQSLGETAARLRGHALKMVHKAGASHIGSCLSLAEILSALYFSTLNIDPADTKKPDRDRFLLSKGHAAAILYAALAERGYFPVSDLETYCQDDSLLTGHINKDVPGIEVATGSLGHALPIACGMALAGKGKYRVFVVLSDGELDEGSNWEAILFAGHHHLDNLVAIIDYNKIQSLGNTNEILNLEPLSTKFSAFNWSETEIDGHDLVEITSALKSVPFQSGRPTAIIAHTVKGKGISFMENKLEWHYRSPKPEELAQALGELGLSK
jgi:transketolase